MQIVALNFLSKPLHTGELSPMNEIAIETLSTFGVGIFCITAAIMVLALFFKLSARVSDSAVEPDSVAIRGVLKKDTWATVHMTGSEKTFERVKFVGFTNSASIKHHLPYQLDGMVILEDPLGCKFLVRAKNIRMIVVEKEKK